MPGDADLGSTSRLVRDLTVAGASFAYALGAFLLGVPVYLLNRKRMTPPPGPPSPVDAVSTAPVTG